MTISTENTLKIGVATTCTTGVLWHLTREIATRAGMARAADKTTYIAGKPKYLNKVDDFAISASKLFDKIEDVSGFHKLIVKLGLGGQRAIPFLNNRPLIMTGFIALGLLGFDIINRTFSSEIQQNNPK